MRKLLLFLIAAAMLWAQKAPYPTPNIQLLGNNGNPLSGGYLYTCVAGLSCAPGSPTSSTPPSNPLATYTTAGGGSSNTNPVVLDSAGRANVWTTPGLSYKFQLYTSANVQVWSVDNIPGGSLIGASNVSANTVYAGPATGAASTPTFRALVAADFAITPTTCTNQFASAISAALVLTCTSPVIAGPQFANQGSLTTVPHGNPSGNPSWANVAGADFGTGIAARTHLGNNTASAAAPGFSTTVDALAFQVAEMPSFAWVTTDFTTSGVGTALETITGLTFIVPATTPISIPFACHLTYHQNVAAVAVAFGIQDTPIAPSNILAQGIIGTNTTAFTQGTLVALTTTTATAIVSATPSAITTDWTAQLSGLIEAPSNASPTTISIRVSTATAADTVTVKRGSFCRIN